MKKRILSGLLLMATCAVGVSTFTSCKDTDEDLRTEFTSQQMSLEASLKKLQDKLNEFKQCACSRPTDDDLLNWLKSETPRGTIEGWFTDQFNEKVDKTTLFGKEGEENGGIIGGMQKNISDILEKLKVTETLTGEDVAKLEVLITQSTALGSLANNQAKLIELANNSEAIIKLLGTTPGTGDSYDDKLIWEAVNKLESLLGKPATDGNAATGVFAEIATLDNLLNNPTNGLIKRLETAEGSIIALGNDVSGIKVDVKSLNKWFDNIGIDAATFQDYVMQGQWVKNNKLALEAMQPKVNELYEYIYGKDGLDGKKELIDKLDKNALDALNQYYKEFNQLGEISKLNTMYNTLFPKGMDGEEWWSYKETMDAIGANKSAIESIQTRVSTLENKMDALSSKVNRIEDYLNDMVTSILLQTTTNPLFGSINTPFGVNSMVLMAYYGKLSTGLESFPASNQATEYCGDNVDPALNSINWSSMMANANASFEPKDFDNTGNLIATNENDLATLGTLWFTVNPTTVANLNGTFTLVNSVDKEVPVKFETVKDNETIFKFGFGSRSAENNGLYRAEAYIDPAELDNIKINIEPGLKDALIDAVKNHTVTDIAHMLKTVYYQLQNVCDANALRYSWNSYDAQNNLKENKVYTNYGLAATAFKPLSFHTLYGSSFRQIPHIGSIQLDKNDFKFDFGKVDLGDIKLELDLEFESVKIDDVADTWVKVKIPARYDVKGDQAVLPDNWEDGDEWSETNPNGTWKYVEFNLKDDLNKVVGEIRDAIDNWVYGDDENEGFNKQIENAVNEALESSFNGPDGFKTKIENQIKSIEGNIQDKVDDLVNKINRDYLNKVNNFLGKVNKVSDRINNVLADPNHYLQSMMMYKDASGNFHMLSTDPERPSQFKGNGEAIELFATTYNFETICPVFKKFVGVNKVTTKNGTADVEKLKKDANVADNYMGTVFEGDHQRVALNVKGATKGVYTYEIAYQALDFHGYTSTVKCYIQVIR